VPTVGIAGLTLGGGWGNLHGRFGLAIDNVIGADVVTADGRFLTATASENEDLFWGIRGGSGNFGVVTSIQYRLHEVGPVYGGAVFYPAAKAKEILRSWREFSSESPDELVNQATSITLDGTPAFGVAACYCGAPADGEKVVQPLRKFATPIADMLGPMSYLQIQSMFEPFFPPGRLVYTKSNFLRNLGDDAIETLAQYVGKSPSPYTFAPFVEHWHGAATRVAPPRRLSLTASIPGTFLPGPSGATPPKRKRTYGGPANVGKVCDRFWWEARTAITAPMRATRSRTRLTAAITIVWRL